MRGDVHLLRANCKIQDASQIKICLIYLAICQKDFSKYHSMLPSNAQSEEEEAD